MKYLVTILLLFISIGAFAQKHTNKATKTDRHGNEDGYYSEHWELKYAIDSLNQALINRDSLMLKKLLSEQVSYGHSNGWVQSKKDVISDLFNGKLIYKAIKRVPLSTGEYSQTTMNEYYGCAWVRMNSEVEVSMDGKPMQLTLSVLQVWVRENKKWVLFARQSTKI